MLWGFVLSVAALIGGIYDKAHFVPIDEACHTVPGAFGRVFSSQVNADCSVAGTVAPWATLLIVAGAIGLAGFAAYFCWLLWAANTKTTT